jgi:hypothetical protein
MAQSFERPHQDTLFPTEEQPVTVLRPLGLGDLLDHAFTFYRRHFWVVVGTVAVLAIPLGFLQAFIGVITAAPEFLSDFDPDALTGTMIVGAVLLGLLFLGYSVVLAPWITSAIALGVAQKRVDETRRLTVGGLLGQAGRSLGSLIGAYLLVLLLTLGMLITLIFPPLFVALSIFAGTAWLLLPQVVVLEGVGPVRALTRAWTLVKRSFWRVFGYSLLLSILGQVIVGIPTAFLSIAGAVLMTVSPLLSQMVNVVVTTFATLVWTPFYLIAITLLYLDLRVRQEGLDLSVQAEALRGDPLAALAAPPPPDETWFTNDALKVIGILTGVFLLVFGVLCGCILVLGMAASGLEGGGF